MEEAIKTGLNLQGLKKKGLTIKSVIFGAIASVVSYFIIDVNSVIDNYIYIETPAVINTKDNFKQLFNNAYYNMDTVSYSQYIGDINIDESLFSETSVRLNEQVYATANMIYTSEHLVECFGEPDTVFEQGVVQYINPLIPLAITYPETASRSNSKYTWTSAIYSKMLANMTTVNMNTLQLSDVNTMLFYNDLEYRYVLYCGKNRCNVLDMTEKGGPLSKYHVHFNTTGTAVDSNAYNDNDSLGPLQIRRHYVENAQKAVYNYQNADLNTGVTFKCGASTKDLIRWEDNLQYNFHNYLGDFMKVSSKSYLANLSINNSYHLAVMAGVANNTGTGWVISTEAGVSAYGNEDAWKNRKAVYDYAAVLTMDDNIAKWNKIIDQWYEWYINKLADGGSPCLAGDSSYFSTIGAEFNGKKYKWSEPYEIADTICGIRTLHTYTPSTASSVNDRVSYAVKILLDYMSLERLYYSGNQ